MDRKTWGPFTGTQLTILFTAAILATVPTALWSVAAYTNVAIQDPVTGAKTSVETGRLKVYDPVAAADETPANFVQAFFFPPSNACSNVYTVPAGKALIIKALHAYLFKQNTGSTDLQIIMYTQASCAGPVKAAAISGGTVSQETKALEFGSGIAVPAGRTISVSGLNNAGSGSLYGYLVPAAWVPASASSIASEGPVTTGPNPLSTGTRR